MTVLEVDRSIGGLSWKYKRSDDRLALALSQKYNLPDLVSRLLTTRGVTLDNAEEYLNPKLKNNLPNPFSLKDMERAASRMATAVINGEPIGLMGDYDVDGATSTALLKMFLEKCGTTVFCFIPDRDDGYGPNAAKMHEFYQKGCRVVATLDCGMTAFSPIDEGTKAGLDILVLDHHDPEKQLPNAYAVVNPKRLDEPTTHPCRYMAAVGVVFLFTVALNVILRSKGFYKNKSEPNLMTFLDLVAFGTVCDVVKLIGVNRLFVKSGLNQMKKGENVGLTALAELVNLSEPATTYHLGYVFGPRINACGRVGTSDIGMKLLSCSDPVQAHALAHELEELNLMRRDIESTVLLEAIEQVESKPLETPFIVVQGENWHQGVVGIVAGRLKDKYNLPVFALSIEGDEVKGSSRSVQGVDLGSIIMNALQKGLLTRGGGHPMAAGFSLNRQKLPDFCSYLEESISFDMLAHDGTVLEVDGILDIQAATPDFMEKINLLAPFGESNPEPCFVIKNVYITKTNLLRNGHIACSLSGLNGGYLRAIAFRAADTEIGKTLLTAKNKLFHVVGTLKEDSWKGHVKIQLQIIDIAPSE